MNSPRILFCASEVAPYAKTGGLADVAGALPSALKQLGCDVRIFMPLYRSTREKTDRLRAVAENIGVPIGVHDFHCTLWESTMPQEIPIYFLEKEEFFDRSALYGVAGRGDYEDNADRFILFSRMAHALCLHLKWFPDVFHLHDWQTGLIAAYHHFQWRYHPDFRHSATIFTIHNLGYQGLFPGSFFPLTQLPSEAFALTGIEFWGKCNFLKAGLVYSDFLTTVSPRYSQEIQRQEFGHGLEGVLQERQVDLKGILNGIDTQVWNPETDAFLPAHYDPVHLAGKQICKEALLDELGFPKESLGRPLLAMISRIDPQKGFDLLLEILEDLMRLPIALVILGTGDAEIEAQLQEVANRYPDQFKLLLQFNEQLAHRIEAGADMFLMPSRYEPCGLNQMYSLRYGTIPIVHATGGLVDSVVDVLQDPSATTGFKFYTYSPLAFLHTIQSALMLFQDRAKWLELQQRAMTRDFSWSHAAEQYLEIYDELIDRRRKLLRTGMGLLSKI